MSVDQTTVKPGLMRRLTFLGLAVLCYWLGALVSLYFVAFVAGVGVPRSAAWPVRMDGLAALVIDVVLLLLWGLQHSLMARARFKAVCACWIPAPLERSVYVLVSSLMLALLMAAWQPLGGVLWRWDSAWAQALVWTLFGLGWLITASATMVTNHAELLGLRQCWSYVRGRVHQPVALTEGLWYRWVRHPMMLGLLLAFWSVPVMQGGQFLFALGMSAYVLIGIHFEERALAQSLGPAYTAYQQRTARLIPGLY